HSMVVVVWAKLFSDNIFGIIENLVRKINVCDANFHVELIGFTHQSVSCFIPDPADQLPPETYRSNFDDNIEKLKNIRDSFTAMRLIANRNIDNVALNLNEESLARICAEYSALMCEHYLSIHPTVLNSREYPFEAFGMSSILFDEDYYRTYIRNRILIDKIADQGVEDKRFSLNSLAQKTNPILSDTQKEIKGFYDKEVANAKAQLEIKGGATSSNVVGTINKETKDLVDKLRARIHDLLTSGQVRLFESEALLALILGEDSSMFESSAVGADEIILDDIIDKSAQFFIDIDEGNAQLKEVSQDEIKEVRNRMRNIAVANRHRGKRLEKLNSQKKDEESIVRHIEDNKYNFEGTGYNVNLRIDTEPLAETYVPHDVKTLSIDLRNSFAPIRNQGQQGSCASFAVTSVIEALSKGTARYSPAFLYWISREAQNSTQSDSGASLYSTIKAATEKGVCQEEEMPYDSAVYTLQPSDSAYDEALKCKVVEAKTVNPKIRDIKSALADGFPVIVASKIFDSFSDTNSGFVSHPAKKELSAGRSDRHGTHALVVCGFSENEKVFVVRNSWGTGFGVDGYCYIPYSYAEKYFLQACIITELSTVMQFINGNGVINFNLSDRKIEDAILKNLIEEDNVELAELASESERLKSDWTENIAILGNVNNQKSIIGKYKQVLDDKIEVENQTIHSLQSSQSGKIKEYKLNYIKGLVYLGALMLISWINVLFFFNHTWAYGIATILTLLFFGVLGAFEFRWRKYRQELRDEINGHAEEIDRIQKKKKSLDIKAYIHGNILTRIEEYRTWLLTEYHKLQLFNSQLESLYDMAKSEQASMTPTVSYPFLAVLENHLLERYYNTWKEKMADSLNWISVFGSYSTDSDLHKLIQDNPMLNAAVMRGLQKFSMKEYVVKSDSGKWQFLPDNSRMSDVIPDLDYRAKPFSPYKPQNEDMEEKYIFIKDIKHDEMKDIMPFFSKSPMPISTDDPYSISILNIVRFNI
ncbi:MAG: hypothetical protein K2G13_02545, partial [Muribaculaceae bacterium]|nr:hypothetical protein [Muribaculaceae bacterium]